MWEERYLINFFFTQTESCTYLLYRIKLLKARVYTFSRAYSSATEQLNKNALENNLTRAYHNYFINSPLKRFKC